jgi:hypothetical protein
MRIVKFFDKLEDKIRGKLSRHPFIYAFLGGFGVVLFWRGVWHLADDVSMSSILSLIIGSVILLMTGAFVSVFIGSRLIISGLYGEKKLTEKAENEIETEEAQIQRLQTTINRLERKIDDIESEITDKDKI